MSLKEAIGLRTHREDPKMFWFQFTLLSLLLWLAAALLSFLHLGGAPGLAVGVLNGLAPCWVLECAVLTWTADGRKNSPPSPKQRLWENQIFWLTAALAVLAELLHQISSGVSYALPVTLAGLAVYWIIRIAAPRLTAKEHFATGEILRILLLGITACVFFARFVAMAAQVLSTLGQ